MRKSSRSRRGVFDWGELEGEGEEGVMGAGVRHPGEVFITSASVKDKSVRIGKDQMQRTLKNFQNIRVICFLKQDQKRKQRKSGTIFTSSKMSLIRITHMFETRT